MAGDGAFRVFRQIEIGGDVKMGPRLEVEFFDGEVVAVELSGYHGMERRAFG